MVFKPRFYKKSEEYFSNTISKMWRKDYKDLIISMVTPLCESHNSQKKQFERQRYIEEKIRSLWKPIQSHKRLLSERWGRRRGEWGCDEIWHTVSCSFWRVGTHLFSSPPYIPAPSTVPDVELMNKYQRTVGEMVVELHVPSQTYDKHRFLRYIFIYHMCMKEKCMPSAE